MRVSKTLNLFLENGFVGDEAFMMMVFRHPELKPRVAHFKTGIKATTHATKISSYDLFGFKPPKTFYYDTKNPGPIIQHLTKLFLIRNPHPSQQMRAAFTRLLHDHSLPSPFSETDGVRQ